LLQEGADGYKRSVVTVLLRRPDGLAISNHFNDMRWLTLSNPNIEAKGLLRRLANRIRNRSGPPTIRSPATFAEVRGALETDQLEGKVDFNDIRDNESTQARGLS
jgi:hypothetical protein